MPETSVSGADESLLRRVIDGLFAFVGLLSPQGELLQANRAALDAADLSPDDVIGRPFWDAWWWSWSPREQERLRDAVARAARGERVRYDAEVRLAGGARITIDFQLSPLRGDDGTITHLVPSGTDVTERRMAEDLLAGIVAHAPVGFAQFDLDLRYVRVNEELAGINGLPVSAHIGATPMELFPGLPADSYLPVFERARGGEVTEFELTGATPGSEGEPRTWLERVYPLRDRGGEIIGIGVFAIDITERKRTVQALQQSLLPRRLPEVSGVAIAARYETASGAAEVGGDFYEVLGERPAFACAALIGDVCGRGIEAAAITSLARYTAVPLIEANPASPAAALHELNRIICDHHADASTRFITVAAAVFQREGEDLRVRIALGGHPHPILVRREGVASEVGVSGTFLGVLRRVAFRDVEVMLRPGDALVLFTDGYSEARGPAGELLGEERLVRAASMAAGTGAEEIAASIDREVGLFTLAGPVRDDRALLVLAAEG